MRKKTPKPAGKPKSKSGKSPVEKGAERNSEVQEEIRIGREFMAQYDATFKELAKR